MTRVLVHGQGLEEGIGCGAAEHVQAQRWRGRPEAVMQERCREEYRGETGGLGYREFSCGWPVGGLSP